MDNKLYMAVILSPRKKVPLSPFFFFGAVVGSMLFSAYLRCVEVFF